MPQDWHKRRTPSKPNPITTFNVIDFKKVHDSYCIIETTYTDGTVKRYKSRVIRKIPQPQFLDQRKKWVVDGMHIAVVLYDDISL